MKKTVILIAIALSALVTNAQGVTNLKEVDTWHSQASQDMVTENKSYNLINKESLDQKFEEDPITFLNNNLIVRELLAQLNLESSTTSQLIIKGNKGKLQLNFDNNGDILAKAIYLKNILVPAELRHQLYRDYKGWAMVKNKYIARESRGEITGDYFIVTLKKGNKKLNLKINTAEIKKSSMVAVK